MSDNPRLDALRGALSRGDGQTLGAIVGYKSKGSRFDLPALRKALFDADMGGYRPRLIPHAEYFREAMKDVARSENADFAKLGWNERISFSPISDDRGATLVSFALMREKVDERGKAIDAVQIGGCELLISHRSSEVLDTWFEDRKTYAESPTIENVRKRFEALLGSAGCSKVREALESLAFDIGGFRMANGAWWIPPGSILAIEKFEEVVRPFLSYLFVARVVKDDCSMRMAAASVCDDMDARVDGILKRMEKFSAETRDKTLDTLYSDVDALEEEARLLTRDMKLDLKQIEARLVTCTDLLDQERAKRLKGKVA